MTENEEKNLLQMKKITKKFPGVLALDKVDFELNTGQIHALVGENGAGKSTLMKILSGVHRQDGGEIILDGKEVNFSSPIQAIDEGISVIYQELNLIEDLTVAENIYVGKEGTSWWNLNKRKLVENATKLLESLNFPIKAKSAVRKLNVSEKQLVEIARAMATNARIIVMDEPTATITQHETELLFKLMRELREKGIAIVFISHRLEEVFEIADSVTVLRDGKYISSGDLKEYSEERLVSDMVGRRIDDMFPKENKPVDEIAFKVEGLNIENLVSNVGFEVKKGEIFGIAGLVGSGKSEIALGIYGGLKASAKNAELFGEKFPIPCKPDTALSRGILLIPEDRKNQGLVIGLNILQNIILPNTEFASKFIHINWKKGQKIAGEMINKLAIKTPSQKQRVANLSGGNQQKVVIAKGLVRTPKLVIFVEPTRGIDVGAKVEVYRLINELANRGVGIIIISSELPEVVSMSDRVLVMHRGVPTEILEGSDINQERIIAAAMGG